MNEMDVMREFRAGQPAADPAALAHARRELLRAARVRPVTRFALSRLRWRLAVSGGLAAVVALSLVVARAPADSPRPESRQDSEAAKVLRLAAQTAESSPYPAVRPDQFVLVESTGTAPYSSHWGTKLVRSDRRVWLSVDGAHDGLLLERPWSSAGPWTRTVLPGCRNGKMAGMKGGQVLGYEHCTISDLDSPVLAGLPTNADDMLDYLYRHGRRGRATDREAWTTVGDLIGESYGRPAVVSALFSAAARIPKVSVVHDVVDAAGRHGIAVARITNGIREELIFDPKTYEYLGERGVTATDDGDEEGGDVVVSTAITRRAITDRAGSLP